MLRILILIRSDVMLYRILGVKFESVGEFIGCVVKSLAGIVIAYGCLFMTIVLFNGVGGWMTW